MKNKTPFFVLFLLIYLHFVATAVAYKKKDLKRLKSGERNLHGIDLSGADLSHLKLRNVILTGTNLSDTRLINTDLTGALLNYTNLKNADLGKTVPLSD